MNATTIRNVRPVRNEMERQHTGQNPKERIYVSAMQRRRKARRARKAKAAAAVAILWLAEVLIAALAGALAAMVLIPLAKIERGYIAFGGEWLIILAITMAAYHYTHKAVFERLER